MKTISCLALLALLLFVSSCKDEENSMVFEDEVIKGENIVIQERDPANPWIPYEERERDSDLLTRGTALTFRNTLGRSYRVNELYDHMTNVGIDVIDINKFNKENPGYFNPRQISEGRSKAFSYAGFDRYESNSSKTQEVSGGFNLNLGLFSLGSKNKMVSTFTTNIVNESNRVFGELYVMIKDSSYVIKPTENVINKLTNYVTKNFKEELYMNTPEQFFHTYGGFVIAGFTTGGCAEVLYSGKSTKNTKEETAEKNMSIAMDASYGFDLKGGSSGSVSGNLGIGKKYGNGTSTSKTVTQITTSVRTLGGSPEYASFSIPKSIDNIDINLNEWLRSLSDKNKHTIVEFAEEGLIPITEFILEHNLKRDFLDFYENGVQNVTRIQEPKIQIAMIGMQRPLYHLGVFLINRFNHKICIGTYTTQFDSGQDCLDLIKRDYSKIFGLKIELFNVPLNFGSGKNYKFNVNSFDENEMKKWIDEDGKIYLINKRNSIVGDVVYTIQKDQIVNDYAMRTFIDKLPTAKITIKEVKEMSNIFAL